MMTTMMMTKMTTKRSCLNCWKRRCVKLWVNPRVTGHTQPPYGRVEGQTFVSTKCMVHAFMRSPTHTVCS